MKRTSFPGTRTTVAGAPRHRGLALKTVSAAMLAVMTIALLGVVAPAPAAAAPRGPSTFDLYSPFLSNTVSSTSPGTSEFLVRVKSIFPDRYLVNLSCGSASPYLAPSLGRGNVLITKIKPEARVALSVKVAAGTPEGSVGWVSVTARRGGETHTLNYRITVQNSKPSLELSVENGAKEQELQLSTGAPVGISLKATNHGASSTAFPLAAQAPTGWMVRFENLGGDSISGVTVGGVKPYIELPGTTDFKAVVVPGPDFAENPPATVTFLAGGASTSVRIAKQGLLWCANDMGGIYPHVHQVRSGGTTTWSLRVTNTTGRVAAFTLQATGVPAGWNAALAQRVCVLAAGKSKDIALSLTVPDGAPVDQAVNFAVEARGAGASDTVSLAARVNNTPKVYYFSIDSMSYGYLGYDSRGTGQGRDGDWLMPNIHKFMGDSVSYTNAEALMPAATDMNHTSAVSGCYPGTEGIYCVSMTFNGTTEQGRMITQPTSLNHGMTMENGNPVKVERIFELAKQANPEALCAFITNKSWLEDLECDPATQTAVERSVTSDSQPVYIPTIEKYTLGDPPSDNDPLLDPMQKSTFVIGASHMITEKTGGVLIGANEPAPRPLLNLIGADILPQMDPLLRWAIMPANVGVGGNPQGFGNDSYFGNSLVSLIGQEDPDVTYTNLGELDETGHLVGSAEDPTEWDTKGTSMGRDDTSSINNYAIRDDAIDVARQADIIFGQFVDTLKSRGVYDSSIIVMMSDHGMHNYKRPEKGYKVLDNRELLRGKGFVMGTDYDYHVGAMDYDLVYSRNKANLPAMEQVLEEYTLDDPVDGTVHPMVVFNREEMKTGVDARTGITVNPGEFYSSYWTQFDQAGADTMKWPDLFVYMMDQYYSRIYADTATSGANAIGIKAEVNLPAELSVMATGGHISFNTRHVPLVFKSPGVNPGSTVGQPVHLSDIAPTIYGLMGWTTPSYVDGKPLPLPQK
ncbi:MAG: alkaline phosphatase family protein [Candidatus Geothermincolia bacterium]